MADYYYYYYLRGTPAHRVTVPGSWTAGWWMRRPWPCLRGARPRAALRYSVPASVARGMLHKVTVKQERAESLEKVEAPDHEPSSGVSFFNTEYKKHVDFKNGRVEIIANDQGRRASGAATAFTSTAPPAAGRLWRAALPHLQLRPEAELWAHALAADRPAAGLPVLEAALHSLRQGRRSPRKPGDARGADHHPAREVDRIVRSRN